MLSGDSQVGLSVDLAKAFDSLPHGVMLRLLSELGMDERVLRPLRTMYTRLRRRFRLAGAVGEEFSSTNGIVQGCPFSVVLLSALVAV